MASSTPAAKKKTVYLIRHAESEENRRLGSFKNVVGSLGRFSLPRSSDLYDSLELLNVNAQVDSPVSGVGVQQIENMAKTLGSHNFLVAHNIQLVAHSPLERARQTCHGLLGCRAPDTIMPNSAVQRVLEVELLHEKYPSEWVPGQYYKLQQRISDFEAWLHEQPESTVALVGHSQYFKAMLQLDFKFGNCDVWKVDFDGAQQQANDAESVDGASSHTDNSVDIDENTYQLPPRWSALKKLYTCSLSTAKDKAEEG